jgi:hypothetical protein
VVMLCDGNVWFYSIHVCIDFCTIARRAYGLIEFNTKPYDA